MKILNTLLCFALLTFVSSQAAIIEVAPADARMMMILSGPAGNGGAEAGCVSGATLTYNGDHSSGVNYACDGSGDPLNATAVTAAVDADSVAYSAEDKHIYWPIDSNEIDDEIGTIWFSAYVGAGGDIGTNIFIEISKGTDNRLYIQTDGGSNDLYVLIRGNGDGGELYSASNFTQDTWIRAAYTWSAAGDKHRFWTTMADAWETEATPTLSPWGTAIDYISIGESFSGINVEDSVEVKDVSIHNTYQAADPLL